MRYVVARFNQSQRDAAYRIYITDALKLISESACKGYGGQYLTVRYVDVINPQPKNEPTESASEIISRMKEGLNNI